MLNEYDIAIPGGVLAGASLALLLRREMPGRVLHPFPCGVFRCAEFHALTLRPCLQRAVERPEPQPAAAL